RARQRLLGSGPALGQGVTAMTKKDWQRLQRQLEINTRLAELKPIEENELDEFGQPHAVKLPQSRRTFFTELGAGDFRRDFKIAVPGYQGKAMASSLEHLNRMAHEGQEYDLYSKDPEQHKRGLCFCLDILGSFHFFDPAEVTDSRRHEFAIYTV